MSFVRRFAQLASGLLLFHLNVLGGGVSCVSHQLGSQAPARGQMEHRAHAPVDESPTDDEDSEPRVAEACVSMASCSASLTFPTTALAAITTVQGGANLPDPSSPNSEPAPGPAVPPPRG